MNTKQQGDVGVASAIFHYTKQGHTVCAPLTDNARYDLVVDMGHLRRVQVKTSGYKTPYGIYQVMLQTSGGNRSGVGKTKRISESECDLVFVYTLAGDSYEFPVGLVAGMKNLNLGKIYEEYKL